MPTLVQGREINIEFAMLYQYLPNVGTQSDNFPLVKQLDSKVAPILEIVRMKTLSWDNIGPKLDNNLPSSIQCSKLNPTLDQYWTKLTMFVGEVGWVIAVSERVVVSAMIERVK